MNWTVTRLPVELIRSLTFRPKPQYFAVTQHMGRKQKVEKTHDTRLFSLDPDIKCTVVLVSYALEQRGSVNCYKFTH